MRSRRMIIWLSLLFPALAACSGTAVTHQAALPSPTAPFTAVASPTNIAGSLNPTEGAAAMTPIERVAQLSQPSVARISVSMTPVQRSPFGQFGGQAQVTGTGMVLDRQGHILTNNHVVTLEGGNVARIVSVDLPSGKTVPASVSGTDPQTDLAVIQVGSDDRGGLAPIQWADPNSILVGEEAVAIGYALNLGGAPTVTTGVVSAIDRTIPESDATISGAIQTDAAINPGNSGGPLFDLNGKVIGVNTAGLAGSLQQPVQGLNFAISVQTAQPVVQALISKGHVTRGYMGVMVTDVTPAIAQANNLGSNAGAGIGQVTSGSPADQAGLRAGDVLTKVGDLAIKSTGDLAIALTTYGPGRNVPLVYYRGKNQQTTTITLGQPTAGDG